MAIEGWGLAVAAGAAVAGIAGAAISSSAQAGAAKTAAQAQEDAAQLQANTQAGEFNATQVQANPARTAGGEALAQESYLLGLNPNLDISGDTAIAQINPQLGNSNSGGVTYSGQGSANINGQINPSGSTNGVPNSGANATGGYGSINGVPTSGTAPSNGFNLPTAPTPGSNGWGGQPAVSGGNVQQPQAVNAFGGGTAPTTGGASNLSLGMPATSTVGQPPATASAQGFTPGQTGGPSINPISGTPNTAGTSGGYGSLSSVYNPSTFYNDPSYQFELGTQELAANKTAAASGGLYSSGALDNAMTVAQGLASTDYNNAFNRSQSAQNQQFNYLQALTGGGQVATNTATAAGTAAANGISSAAAGYGNASAAGTIGAANATTNGINQATGFVTNLASNPNVQNGFNSTPSYSSSDLSNPAFGSSGSTPGTMNVGGGYQVNVPN